MSGLAWQPRGLAKGAGVGKAKRSVKARSKTALGTEARFRLTIDHANDAIVYLDLDGIIQWGSRQTAILTGRPMAELVNRSLLSVLTPEAAAIADARLAAVRHGESVPPLVEFDFLRPDGEKVSVE